MKPATQRHEHGLEPRATIVRVLEVGEMAFTVTARESLASPWRVRCALPPGTHVREGDEIVVLDCEHEWLAIARVGPALAQTCALSDCTRIEVGPQRESLSVRRADGAELFRYDVRQGHGTLTLESEALTLAARTGDLRLQAAGEIQLESRSLRVSAAQPGSAATTLRLSPREAALQTTCLRYEVGTLDLRAAQAQFSGGELRTRLARAVLDVNRVDAVFDVVHQTARSVCAEVRELFEQRLGSLRTFVAGTAQLRAREVMHRAEDAYKVRSEKIHLG